MTDRIVMGFVLFFLGWQVGGCVDTSRAEHRPMSREEVESIARHVFCQAIVETRLVSNCTVREDRPDEIARSDS